MIRLILYTSLCCEVPPPNGCLFTVTFSAFRLETNHGKVCFVLVFN